MAEFVLVHGAWHGAWCWDELREVLARRGHRSHAPDLPGLGDDPTPPAEVTLAAYAGRVAEVVRSLPAPVILVGHSMGGLVITEAAGAIADRLHGLVYVAAYAPGHGQSLLDLSRNDADTGLGHALEINAGTASVAEAAQHDVFYHRCSAEQSARARARLVRQQPLAPLATPVSTKDATLAALSRLYLLCAEDRAIAPANQRAMAEAAGIARVATLETDHSPFLSCPEALADALDTAAAEAR